MTAFRLLLVVIIATLFVYTAMVVANHGMGLFPVFFGDIARMGWPGQFNLDFMGFLILAGVWIAWRHHFSPGGILLGAVVPVGGVPYVATYLLITSFQTGGNAVAMLIGSRRAAG